MWILPKSLISAFAQDTEALTLGCVELSQTCARSLMRRSKPSQSSAYLREWKAGKLMRLRSGAISSRFLGQSFLGWWTFSLAATRVSHLVQQENEQEQTTSDTSGHLSQVAFKWYDPGCAFSRTWKDTLALDSEKSLQTWKALVTKRRGEYFQRLNAARLTSGNESLFLLPTPTAMEYKDIGEASLLARIDKGGRVARRLATLNLQLLTGRVKVRVGLLEQMMGVPIGWTECASLETE